VPFIPRANVLVIDRAHNSDYFFCRNF